MKRRDFLRATTATTLALPYTIQGMPMNVLTEQSSLVQMVKDATIANDNKILVMVNLIGGNDGLNTVIPLDQYSAYNGLRSNVAIPENKVLSLAGSPETGLHPAMTGLRDLYNNGQLSIIHSVSYPNPNQSHFRSADIWMSGVDHDQYTPTGWAGRYLQDRFTGYPTGYPNASMEDPLALQIGYLTTPTLQGNGTSTAVTIDSPENFYNLIGAGSGTPPQALPPYTMGEQIAYIRQQQALAIGFAGEIKNAGMLGTNMHSYPMENYLADQLKVVARLIHGGLKTKIFFVTQYGYDTHSMQVEASDKTTGTHAKLLQNLSDAIAAFQADITLMGLADRIIGMTFSEFGRRADSNASRGTDHGVAAPMFVFGNGVKKQTIGMNPNLTTGLLPTNPQSWETYRDIKMQIDFRRVYADILRDWFGTSETKTNEMLFKNFKTLSLFKDTIETSITGNWNDATTWSSGRKPLANEHVLVKQGHVLEVNQNTSIQKITADGTIKLKNGATLTTP
jgi:uncharacterized protein (DUF1501 family)